MTNDEKKMIDMLKNGTTEFRAKMKSIFESMGGGTATPSFTTTAFGGVNQAPEEYKNMMVTRRKLMQDFGEASRFAADGQKLLEQASVSLFGTTEAGLKATEALTLSMRTFAFMNKDVQRDLGETTMILNEFGVRMDTTGEILDTAAMAFGFSQEKLKGLANELATVVYRFPGQASEIARNFKSAQSSLAYDSKKIMEVFKKLQYTSSTTGVEFSKLTSVFGDQMDTFETSATKAGSLNAILGRSVFNSIDLLGKTEAERVDTIVQGVRSSIGGDVNRLGKFQLKAVAEGMGLTVEETRRLLSGDAKPEDIMKGKEDPRKKLEEQSLKAREENTMSLENLRTEFKLYRSQLANMQIKAADSTRKTALEIYRKIPGLEMVQTHSEALDILQNMASGGDPRALRRPGGTMSESNLARRRGPGDGGIADERVIVATAQQTVDYIKKQGEMLAPYIPAGLLEKFGYKPPEPKKCPEGQVLKDGKCVKSDDPETGDSTMDKIIRGFKGAFASSTIHITGLTDSNVATAIVKNAKK